MSASTWFVDRSPHRTNLDNAAKTVTRLNDFARIVKGLVSRLAVWSSLSHPTTASRTFSSSGSRSWMERERSSNLIDSSCSFCCFPCWCCCGCCCYDCCRRGDVTLGWNHQAMGLFIQTVKSRRKGRGGGQKLAIFRTVSVNINHFLSSSSVIPFDLPPPEQFPTERTPTNNDTQTNVNHCYRFRLYHLRSIIHLNFKRRFFISINRSRSFQQSWVYFYDCRDALIFWLSHHRNVWSSINPPFTYFFRKRILFQASSVRKCKREYKIGVKSLPNFLLLISQPIGNWNTCFGMIYGVNGCSNKRLKFHLCCMTQLGRFYEHCSG